MKAVSITQPWAALLAHGFKTWFAARQQVLYRGPVAIHASETIDPLVWDLCWEEPFRSALAACGFRHGASSLPRGVVVAVADLVACVPRSAPEVRRNRGQQTYGDGKPGKWRWRIANARPFADPPQARGRLGLFNLPDHLIRSLTDATSPA